MDTTPEHGGNWGGTAGFNFAKRQLDSKARFVSGDIYEINPAAVGQFDIVFFFGVLYHLTNPMLALSNLLKVTREYCLIETACSGHPDGGHLALWEFVPGLDNDPTNYWYPTPMGLIRCLQHAGFRRFDAVYYDKARMTIRAFPPGPEAMESSSVRFSLNSPG